MVRYARSKPKKRKGNPMKLLLDILENIVIIVFVVYIVGGLVLYNFLY